MVMPHEFLKVGYVFVPIAQLDNLKAVLPVSIVGKIGTAIMRGENAVAVPAKQLANWQDKMDKYNQQQELLAQCSELNNAGLSCERTGDIAGAIRYYEQNIELGYPAHHAFKRLLVLYRKEKDYVNELRVAQRACRIFPKEQSYKDRREKIKELQKRAKAKGK